MSSPRFGGKPISLPTSGPIGIAAFIIAGGIVMRGGLRPPSAADLVDELADAWTSGRAAL